MTALPGTDEASSLAGAALPRAGAAGRHRDEELVTTGRQRTTSNSEDQTTLLQKHSRDGHISGPTGASGPAAVRVTRPVNTPFWDPCSCSLSW